MATLPTPYNSASLDLDGVLKHHSGPRFGRNVLSRLTFWPATRLVRVGAKRVVNKSDLWELEEENKSEQIWKAFSKYWKEEKKQSQPSVFRALRRTFIGIFMQVLFLHSLSAMLLFVQPVLLPYMIEYLSDLNQPAWLGYMYAALIVVSFSLSAIIFYQATIRAWTLGLKIRSALIVLIYRKVLKLAPEKGSNSGDIINLISNDAQQILDTIDSFSQGLIGPLVMVGALVLLWLQIGPYSLICLGVLFLSIPLDIILSAKVSSTRVSAQKATDNRLKLVHELLSSIRIVKSYAWEKPFKNRTNASRDDEVAKNLAHSKALTLLWYVIMSVPPISVAVTYISYGSSTSLDYVKVWTAMTLFNIIRQPIMSLPVTLSSLIQNKVAIDRIQAFMMRREINKLNKAPPQSPSQLKVFNSYFPVFVEAQDCDLSWDPTAETPILRDVNFKIKRGQLFMIIGKVGSGKSTLAQAILGEVPILRGYIKIHSSVAYVPQEAWILNGSLRDNILFGKPYIPKFYEKVIYAAGLVEDISRMPAGDLTQIGDRGINLSGGQKQRISIARAMYSNRDIYILDDPLSALDSSVSSHVFSHGIQKFLKDRRKTVILITNQLHYLPYADCILMLKDGQIVEQGKFNELKNNGKEFAAMIAEFAAAVSPLELETSEEGLSGLLRSFSAATIYSDCEDTVEFHPKKAELNEHTEEEERETGSIGFDVYWYMFRAGGVLMFLLVLLFALATNACRVAATLWLSTWSSDVNYQWHSIRIYILIYGLLSIGESLFLFLFLWTFVHFTARASRSLHKYLLDAIVRATVTFFDTTPFGRLMSRFAKDMTIADLILPLQLVQYIDMMFVLLCKFALVIASSWYLIFPVVIVLIGYWLLSRYYRKTAIEIQRLESLSRAPILSHLAETVEGATSIRAYGMNKAFKVANLNKIDANALDFFSLRYSNMWLGIRLDWFGSFLLMALFLVIVILRNFSTIDPALGTLHCYVYPTAYLLTYAKASVSMSSVVTLTVFFASLAMSSTETETREKADDQSKPPKEWPKYGEIKLKNLTVSYNDRDVVLDNITATIKAREKVGVVGRTGAGKSTLFSALLRLVEPKSGKILIDGINVCNIGLHDLRSKISIIPQYPVMFTGTVRYNLDPFNEHTDVELWSSLEMVQLKQFISEHGGLDYVVEEGGQNFSVGQRQMLCMARALLRNSSILLLDEATASLDSESDALIQKMVREHFADKTVITIAHRLNTIMDSDRVMVLDNGKIVEFGTPRELIVQGGVFASMVDAAGNAVAEQLRAAARGDKSSAGSTSVQENVFDSCIEVL